MMQSAFVWAPKFGFDLEAGVREAIESCKGAGVEDSFLKSILLLCRSLDTVQIAVAVGMICEFSHNVLEVDRWRVSRASSWMRLTRLALGPRAKKRRSQRGKGAKAQMKRLLLDTARHLDMTAKQLVAIIRS